VLIILISNARSNQVFIWPLHDTHQSSAPYYLKPSSYPRAPPRKARGGLVNGLLRCRPARPDVRPRLRLAIPYHMRGQRHVTLYRYPCSPSEKKHISNAVLSICHLPVGAPKGTGTLAVIGFGFHLAIRSKIVVKEVMLRGSATPGQPPPHAASPPARSPVTL
jgi:hypothetical protein